VVAAACTLGGCAPTNGDVRTALVVAANAVGKAACGGPIARHAEAEILERRGDDRYGGGRARVRGATGDGSACEGEVLFAYVRRDTPLGLFAGQLDLTSAIVVTDGKPPAPPAEPRLALGVPTRGALVGGEAAFQVDLAQGEGVTLLARGPKPLGVEVSFRGQALELGATPGAAPFFVAPASGAYVVRVRGPEGAPFVVAVLPGGLPGPGDGWAPESRP
jgi:hypothetical protein